MFNKKSVFAIIILLFAISVVSASDVNSTQSGDVALDAFSQNETQLTEVQSDVLESGQTVYFDASASVDGDGSKEKPYKYLSSNKLTNVGTAYFANGNYELDELIKISSASQKITFVGENENHTNIISNSFDFDFKILKGSSLELKDLTFYKINILNQGNLEANNVNFYSTDSYETSLSSLDYNGDVYDSYGGVIVCDSPEDSKTNITLNNCIFHSNSGESGAVIDAYNSNVLINNSYFYNSTSRRFGGVIYSLKSVLRIFNSEFNLNSAKYGGVIYAEDNYVDLLNSRFFNSQSSSFGGVMAVKSSTVTSNDCYFSDNIALSDGGGTFYDENCSLSIVNGVFRNGKSDFGGAICNLNSNLIINNIIFDNNAATFMGGVIFNDRGNIYSKNSHFQYSHANSGGAIYSRIYDSVTLTNTTFYNSEDNFGHTVFRENNTIYDLNSNQAVPLINYVPESQTNVPSYYDSRDYGYISPIKNQFSGANCWSFGSIATLEACLKKATGISYDLSEENVKNLMSYYSLFGRTYEPNEGGVDSMAMSYFASWLGPVNDSLDEYDDYSGLSEVFSPLVHVQNIYCLPVRKNTDDNDAIKRAIMDYGAVTASVNWTGTYHTISLIGWDDNYNAKDIFGNYAKGAWIVKNSWGTVLEDGFCHMSYQEQFKNEILPPLSNFVYTFIFNDTKGYTRNYQYDFGGPNYIIIFNGSASYKNTFTSFGDEKLSAFSTFFIDPTNYEVSVYVGNNLVLTQKGYSPAGYYTIPFNSPIKLASGTKFTIVIKNYNSGNNSIPLCDASRINKVTFADNVSFIYNQTCDYWQDLYDYKSGCYVACIKAFTTPLELKDVTITVDKLTEVEAYKEISINVKLSNSQINGGTVAITINNKNYYAYVKNGQACLKVTFNETGTYSLSAEYKNNIYKSNIVKFNFNVIKPVISISAPDVSKYYGGPEKFTATVMKNDRPLVEDYVTININGKSYSVKTNTAGQASIDLNQAVGIYDVTTVYGSDSKASKVTIKSTIAVRDVTGSYFNAKASGTFLNANGQPLAGKEVTFKINNMEFKATTNNNGVATAKIDLNVGSYNVIAVNQATKEEKQFKLTITKSSPDVSIFTSQIEDSVTITVSLNPSTATGNIVFTFEQEDYPSSIHDGKASLIITDLKSGSYNYSISYAGDANLNGFTASKKFDVTSNVVVSASDLEKYYGNPESFKVYITDNDKPLSGAVVNFIFQGDVYAATTGSDGIASIKIPLGPGIYEIKYQYKDISGLSKIIVKTTVTADNLSYVYEDSYVKATFMDSEGKAISNANVAFKINDVNYKGVTDSKGVASTSVLLGAGNYNVEVTNPATNEFKQFKLTVSKKTPKIEFLTDDNGKILIAKLSSAKATGKIIFTFEGKDYPEQIVNGESRFNIPPVTKGTYLIPVKYSGDNNFNSYSTRVNVNVIDESPVLSANSVNKVYGDSKRLIIKLVDYKGNPIKNAKVYANVVASNGVKFKYYTLTTNANGEAKLACNFPAKTYSVVISSSSCKNIKAKVVVKKAATKLYASSKSFKLKVKPKKYVITLKNNLNKAMKRTKVTLKIGRITYSTKTNNYGKATFKITKLNKKGTYAAKIRYGGNAYYKGVSKNVKIRVV